jgi:hypothetical protein
MSSVATRPNSSGRSPAQCRVSGLCRIFSKPNCTLTSFKALWLSFARDAKKAPSDGTLKWKKYDSKKKTLLSIADGDVLAQYVSPSVVNSECPS